MKVFWTAGYETGSFSYTVQLVGLVKFKEVEAHCRSAHLSLNILFILVHPF